MDKEFGNLPKVIAMMVNGNIIDSMGKVSLFIDQVLTKDSSKIFSKMDMDNKNFKTETSIKDFISRVSLREKDDTNGRMEVIMRDNLLVG